MTQSKAIQNEAHFHAESLIAAVDYLEENYGKNSVGKFKQFWFEKGFYEPWKKLGESNPNDIQTFAKLLENGCAGTHEWIRVVNKQNKVEYKFTKCIWAKIFHKLGRPEIGKWFCESDYIICRAFNPKMEFDRTKTLMDGDDHCDHEFSIKE